MQHRCLTWGFIVNIKKARNTRTFTCIVSAHSAYQIVLIANLQMLSEDDMNTLVMEDIIHHSQKLICL